MLTSAELRAIREHLEDTLPDKCVLQTMTRTADGQGGFTEAWAAAGTVVCRLDNAGGGKKPNADSQRTFSTWTLTVPYDAGLTTAHRVSIGGEDYNVLDVSDAPSWAGVQRARVERV